MVCFVSAGATKIENEFSVGDLFLMPPLFLRVKLIA